MLFNVQSQIIRQLAAQESCIIIGRCADSVLEDYPGVISIFIHAAWPDRVARIMERQNLSEKEAEALIRKMDKQRGLYYNFFSDKKWGRPESFDIMVNSSRVGLEGCVGLICSFFAKK